MRVVGVISLILAVIALLACFMPGAVSVIGVFISLLALLISCVSTIQGNKRYLKYVLLIVTFNIFVVSEFSFALNKYLYSHTETPLIMAISVITDTKEKRLKKEQSRKALERHLGHELVVDYKNKEQGYWQFVRFVASIILIPYLISFYRLYMYWSSPTGHFL